jgi:hypothetical protein
MIGMYQVKNDRTLSRQLVAHVCARPAIIVDLCDAAAFTDMHGDRTRLWGTAKTAVRRLQLPQRWQEPRQEWLADQVEPERCSIRRAP